MSSRMDRTAPLAAGGPEGARRRAASRRRVEDAQTRTEDGAAPATTKTRRRPTPEERQAALIQIRALLQDPDLTADVVARVILGVIRKELIYGAWNTYQRDGRGAVLVDLRHLVDGEVTKQYVTDDALRAVAGRDGPLAALEEAIDTYEPRRELLAIVRQSGAMGCYRINRRSGKVVALPPW